MFSECAPGSAGGMDRRIGAVARHQDVGAAVDAEVGDHSCRTRLTAASASEAVPPVSNDGLIAWLLCFAAGVALLGVLLGLEAWLL